MQRTLAVANYLVEKSGYSLTPLQLVKLVYIAHGYSLGILGVPLFDEEVEAWKFGPVVPSVYHSFKHFARKNIEEKSTELFLEGNDVVEKEFVLNEANEHYENQKKILDVVLELYSKYTGSQLIDITHRKGTPWEKVYKPDHHHLRIKNNDIRNYYKELVNE